MSTPDSWLTRHLKQDAGLLGTLLAFGLSTLVIAVAATVHLDLENESAFALAVVMGPILFLPGPIVLLGRLVRGGRPGARCEACGARPAAEVRYIQVTGIVAIALLREARLSACARCSTQAFFRTTAHTAAFGWWTPLTPLVVPWVLLANTLVWLKCRIRTGGRGGVAAALAPERDYALNLLRTKDEATVAEVLARKTGVAEADVAAWIRTLPTR